MIYNKRKRYHSVFIFTFFIFFFYYSVLFAQKDGLTPPPPNTHTSIKDSPGTINLEKVKAKQSEIEASQTLSDSAKKEALTFIEQAIRFLGELDQIKRDLAVFESKIANAPDRIKEIQSELKKKMPTVSSIKSEIESSDMKLLEIEQKIQQETASLVALDGDINTLQAELEKRKYLPQAMYEEIGKIEQKLEQLQAIKKIPSSSDEHTAVTSARQISLDAERAKWEEEIQTMNQQLAAHDVYISLLDAELELLKQKKKERDLWLASWKDRAQELRKIQASQARLDAEEGRYGASGLPERIKGEFDTNIELTKILDRIIQEEVELEKSLESKKTQSKILEEDYNLSKDRAKILLRTEAIGLALREQRQSLPTFSNYKANSSERRQRMGKVQNALLDVQNKQRVLTDIKRETDRIMESLGSMPEDRTKYLQTEVEKLLNERRNLLDKLSTAYKRQFRTVQNIEFIDQQTVQLARQFTQFLDISLMWIQSSRVLGSKDLRNLPSAIGWVINPRNWYAVLKDLKKSLSRRPGVWILGLVIVGALMPWRRRVRRGFSKIAEKIGHVQEDSFLLTLKVLAMTIYLSIGWPFILLFLSRQLSSLSIPHEFSSTFASGLENVAYFLFLYGFFHLVCREHGLAQAHFEWPEQARTCLKQNLRWLIGILIPVIFLMALCNKSIEFGDSLGRIAFIIGSITVSIFAARVLYSPGSIVSELVNRHPTGLLTRLRYIWSPLIIGTPFAMAVLAALGYYYYTAITFVSRELDTYNLITILVIINELILRWLSITKKRHLFEETERLAKFEQEKNYKENDEVKSSPLELGGKAIVVKDADIGLDQIDEQTRAFLRIVILFSLLIGLWVIWKELLPAFRSVLDITLWTHTANVDNITKLLPVTLGNVVTAIVTIVITVTVTKNLPGILEIAVLKRLKMDPGSRYAFTTIFRYMIIGIGIIVISNIIGLNWSKVQWLIAALGVGLGFGLQEVVANFICGLVILFERPFLVGDVVTVGETSGAVKRIRIRATTITDWDRHELIVPNKEFITGKLINWTLSDPVERIVIPVGITHGSDTALAERILLKVARENPMVLPQPAPSALFLGFEESSLKFELRVFVHGVDKRLPATHQLHQAVDLALKEAGIQISSPNINVHFASKTPVEVRVVPEKGEED